MKSILLSILFLLIPKLAVSQISENDKTIYLDSLWKETTQGNHKYYRIIKDYNSNQELYQLYDYYKSGVLQMEGKSKTKDDVAKEGEFIFYYENGNKKTIANYTNGKRMGKHISYYENGNIEEEGEYTGNYDEAGKSYKLNQYWDENKNHLIIDGNGVYSCGDNLDYTETGKYKDGFKDGIFEGKNFKKNSSFIEKYENGKFISGTKTFADKTKSEYLEMETRPFPKNGMQDFYKYIAKNYRLPNMPKGTKGKVFVTFVVDNDGKIVDIKVLRDIGYGTGEEAIRILKKCDNWIPAEQRGEKVRCSFSLPISLQN